VVPADFSLSQTAPGFVMLWNAIVPRRVSPAVTGNSESGSARQRASADSRIRDAMTEGGAMLQRLALGFFFFCAIHASPSIAARPTMEECLEGSDFIRNVALSRDTGIAADAFLDRMREDFFVIRAFPAELRWFVHDDGDEMFLAEEARLVFEQPSNPDDHRAHFLRVCVDRMAES
jgi:hypothetical protein